VRANSTKSTKFQTLSQSRQSNNDASVDKTIAENGGGRTLRGSPKTLYLMSLPTPPESRNKAYWRAVIRLTLVLLGIWALVSIGAGILFVEPLNKLHVGKLPAGFWMAQQGSILVFVVLIFVYARRMDRLDHKFKKDDES